MQNVLNDNSRRLLILIWVWTLSGLALTSRAQYVENPLKDRRWLMVSGGMNNADYRSWQTGITYSSRGESMITQVRMMFSQELTEGPADSIFFRKNKLAELGVLWGDGWGGNNWYVTGTAGMALNIRMYGDSALQSNTEFRYLRAVTIGIPAQIEAGVRFNKSWGITAAMVGNWNFRQPYFGAHLGLVYHFKRKQ
jgi:hypothetical protein